MQGSYKNSTNIHGDSDVDVVVQLNSTVHSNLSELEKAILRFTPAAYQWANFRQDVLSALRAYYGYSVVDEGKKSLKVKGGNNRLPADVVVCLQYQKYDHSNLESPPVLGMTFWVLPEVRQVINYPKLHYDRGVSKNQIASEWHKPTVRLLKNIRNHMEQKGNISSQLTPSYFLECLLYNVPSSQFGTNYQGTFCNVINWLNAENLDGFFCQNGQEKLFGTSPNQWSSTHAREFINKTIKLWNDWSNAPVFYQYR